MLVNTIARFRSSADGILFSIQFAVCSDAHKYANIVMHIKDSAVIASHVDALMPYPLAVKLVVV